MAQLVPIGNSFGVRLPKALIEQARLDECELEFRVTDEGLLIVPIRPVRQGWKEAFETMHKNGDDKPLLPYTPDDFDDKDWQW